MKPDEPHRIETVPAKLILASMVASQQFYFPEEMRARFEAVAVLFEERDGAFWQDRFDDCREDLAAGLIELENWTDDLSADLVMLSWSDEVFFFYILKIQFLWIRLSMDPDARVPSPMDAFWKWGVCLQPSEGWVFWTFPCAVEFEKMADPPFIWRIPLPNEGG